MKYSFMTFSCPQLSLEQALAMAKDYGYDGIEPRAESKHNHGVELSADASQRADIKRQAAQSGIDICCIATSCRYADPATAGENVERTRQFIDLAADVGSPCLRVFGGPIGGDLSREQAIELVAESLKSVADQAVERNVKVCIETHDDWCDPEHLAEVMRRVDHPGVAINWDIMHPARTAGKAMDSAFKTLKPWIRHVHFHDGNDVDDKLLMMHIGEGIIDHRTAVKCLSGAGYEGFLSGEWIGWTEPEEHLPPELAVMKGFEADLR